MERVIEFKNRKARIANIEELYKIKAEEHEEIFKRLEQTLENRYEEFDVLKKDGVVMISRDFSKNESGNKSEIKVSFQYQMGHIL